MNILERMQVYDHEQVIAFQNGATGLRGFLAIHDTTLGPALGGVRIWPYGSEADALNDALRLSRAMTYKASISELPCGGGKAVIMQRPELKRAEAFEAYGHLVNSLNGRFFTGVDVGITQADINSIARATKYVACESNPELGDICEHTAVGVWHGMRACLESAGIQRARVAIQGVGGVGLHLARILRKEGMEVIVADINPARATEAAKETGARVVPAEEILFVDCDVLAPCALGGVVNRESAPKLKTRIVCGSANNVLADAESGETLARREILYGPDYLVNAGGLVRGAEFYLLGRRNSWDSIERIHHRMRRVIDLAREKGISTARAADEIAESRLKRPKTFADLHWRRS